MQPSTNKNANEIRTAETSENETRSLSAPNGKPEDNESVYEIPYSNHQHLSYEKTFYKNSRKRKHITSFNILILLSGGLIGGISVYFTLNTGLMDTRNTLELCEQQSKSMDIFVSRSFGRFI